MTSLVCVESAQLTRVSWRRVPVPAIARRAQPHFARFANKEVWPVIEREVRSKKSPSLRHSSDVRFAEREKTPEHPHGTKVRLIYLLLRL